MKALPSKTVPNAQNAELKSALQRAASLFQGHFQHAQKVQAELEGNHTSSDNDHTH